MSVLFPGAPDLDTYWRNLRDGVDAIGAVPAGRWDADYYRPGTAAEPAVADRVYCRRGGFVDGLAEVEVTRFGIMPASVGGTEPDQLIALHVAAAALEDAGGTGRLPDRQRVGVVLGRGGYLTPGLVRLDQRVRTAGQLVRTLGELLPELSGGQLERVREAFTERLGPDSPEAAIGLVPNLAASRVASRLDLRGPAYTVDAACASSLVAVDQAVGELASGRCDLMLAGGVHHCHDITLWSVFSQLRALSPTERIRPFHRDADGILIGEGTGVVVLKRLADAERDGDRVYAVIRGTGISSDGRASGLVNPDPGGQARAVRQAWRAAGLDPAASGSLGLLEAHGTATPAGDGAELATLAEVFGGPVEDGGAVIGSVKSMIGHAMPAAGVAGLVKAALAVHHGVLLPTLHCDDPHPALARTRFRPLEKAEPWEGEVRRAAVNAFGFGGINAHVVLEQRPGRGVVSSRGALPSPGTVSSLGTASSREPVSSTRLSQAGVERVVESEQILLFAADSPTALAALLDTDDTTLRAAGLDPTRLHPTAGPARLAVFGPTAKRLALARRAAAKSRPWSGRSDVWLRPTPLLGKGDPGAGEQGTGKPGAGEPVAGQSGSGKLATGKLAFLFPGLEADFAPHVDDVAAHFDLPALPAPGEEVDDVGRHGFDVVAVGRLLDAALRRSGIVPDAVAGHSVGEWTAMVASGLYDGDEVDTFMAEFDPASLTVPGLAFGAIGAPAEQVLDALAELGRSDVVLSHDNAPGQSMVCGPDAAVEEFVRSFRARGVISQVLPFRSGFHTPMLRPHLTPIAQAANRFRLRPPTIPLWSGTTATPFPEDPAHVRALFIRHLLEPVRFRQLTQALYDAGHRVFVQVGPGRLGSLVDDTLGAQDHLTVAANSPHRDGLPQLRRVAAALWTAGAEVAPALPGPNHSPRTQHPPTRLDLSGALISLPPEARPVLRTSSAPLDALADHMPIAAELSALLRETADTATALMAARTTPRRTTVRVSPDTMPYLLDHCFFPQRPNWPDIADRWPVVPATTIVQHIMDTAAEARPGLLPVAVHDARFEEWLTATPAVDVPVTTTPESTNRLAVSFGPRARATVELAPSHPRPAPTSIPAAEERVPDHTAAQLYEERWMFHGPAFQGVTELTAIGDRHVRGVITTPPAPGALLDNVGQLLGYWIMATRTDRTVVFPVGVREIRFYGPHPAPGTQVACLVRITALTDALLEADVRLTVGGEVWAEISGWQDRRFDNDPRTRPVERFPERHTLSELRPGGWTLVHERWPDLASRELIMRNSLGGVERSRYAEHAPRGRRQWLLGRIAAKDAVRRWLWEHGEGPVFPAELRVENDGLGRPYVVGVHGRQLPALDVSLAHCAEAGAAIARPHRPGPGPGIDIEEITARTPETESAALGPDELRLLERLEGSRALWFTRFWAAKEAVAKAEGTGLGGRPREFTVLDATPDGDLLTVSGRLERAYPVHCAPAANPPGLPAREYVVAWTTGHANEEEYDAR
ncbi:beta-ketoacyl synthase N-terminal-like domain-containing protein [Streptomyces sp. NPDC004539]|uniref:beta-ketoacyl synthase N-terminal-like domain-containing protein n=1 Tax=Streptomyces sp. NPDC004539 TaxID=3154280 RepID=UPI0033A59025